MAAGLSIGKVNCCYIEEENLHVIDRCDKKTSKLQQVNRN